MKRFYKLVSTCKEVGGYGVLLDGKPVKTSGKKSLLAPTQGIADALMAEWAAQKDEIDPQSMPFTQILNTKIDRIPHERAAMTEILLEYLDTDLLCYRADYPPELVKMQTENWNPHLKWFLNTFECTLLTTEKLEALRQPPAAHKVVQEFIAALDDDYFTILQLVTSISGSIILALAFTAQEISPEEVLEAARIEERHKATIYDEAKYGPDPMQEKRDKAAMRDLQAAWQYLKFCSD
jgi:chaperone required for assembly of F1-ATPase